MRRRALLACTRPLLCPGGGGGGGSSSVDDADDLTGADIEYLRRTKWQRLGERDRTRVEWLHGNPYYLPSFNGVCETYEDYETRVANLRITEHDQAAVADDARSDLARALEMEKATAQRQLWDRLHESSDWVQAVKGAGWQERAKGVQEDVDRRFRGDPEKTDERTEDQAKRDLHRSDDPYRFPG
eukprot:Rhum_TRINITY_DN14203_c0_g1::Rhum_TRINITY_DN14203_c0_g1_i1::g.73481::m.73481